MDSLSVILNAWKNYLFNSPEHKALAEERAKICSVCPDKAASYLVKLNDEIKEIAGYKCNHCNCPLSTMLRAPGKKCPINKW